MSKPDQKNRSGDRFNYNTVARVTDTHTHSRFSLTKERHNIRTQTQLYLTKVITISRHVFLERNPVKIWTFKNPLSNWSTTL